MINSQIETLSDQYEVTAIQLESLSSTFKVGVPKKLFALIFDYWFVPRTPQSRTKIDADCDLAWSIYIAFGFVPPFFAMVTESKTRKPLQRTQTARLNQKSQLKIHMIQLLIAEEIPCENLETEHWMKIFSQWYRELPTNPLGTSTHYYRGCKDPRWDEILHKLQAPKCYNSAVKLHARWQNQHQTKQQEAT